AAEHALRHSRRPGFPRARRASDARAGNRARRRRHLGAEPTAVVSRAQPGGQGAANRSSVIRYRAAWILPIREAPISDGWVDIDHGRVAALGTRTAAGDRSSIDLGSVAI